MPEPGQQPPTYYVNFVTSMMNVDELTLELRRYITPHREMSSSSETLISIPPPSFEKVLQEEPIARVVMTFLAARALKAYLDEAMPRIEQQRKTEAF